MKEMSEEEIASRVGKMKKLLILSVIFVLVGYTLVIGALAMEVTQFHPAIEDYATSYTEHSLAGGGPDRAAVSGLNQDLAELHKFPSTLLWMKLGGIAHVLVGIFISLVVIVQALMMMPDRLGYKMEKYS